MTVAELQPERAKPESAAAADEMVRRVARNSLWLIIQPLLLNVLSVISTGYIARKLGAADYGAFNLGFAQIAFFTPICSMGLNGIAIREIAQNRDRAQEVASQILATRLVTTTIGTLLAVLWLLLPTYSQTTRLIGLAAVASMVFQSYGGIYFSLFQGFERSRMVAQTQLAGGLTLTLLSVAALAVGLGLPGFVAAYVLGSMFQRWLMMETARRHFFSIPPHWNWTAIRGYLRQARPFALSDVVARGTEASVLDVSILGALFAAGVVGPYTGAISLVVRLAVIPLGLVDALYPAVAHHSGDGERLREALRRTLLYLLLATVPIALCLSFTAPTVLWILFGDEYLSAADSLRVAAWILPLHGLTYLIRLSLMAVHRQETVARMILGSAVVTVAVLWVLIPRFGPLGAALGIVARDLIMLVFWARQYLISFGPAVPWRQLGRGALTLSAMVLPLLVLSQHYTHLGAVVAAVVSFLFYGGAVVAAGLVDVWPGRSRAAGLAGGG